MEAFLLEKSNLKVGLAPVDLNTGANPGIRVPMANVQRLIFIIIMGTSTAASVIANLLQHNAASSGTSKALAVANPYFHKHGTATSFTEVVPGSAADTYDISTQFAADGGIAVFEVLAEDLDVNNGFAWVSLSMVDSTAAKLATILVQTGGEGNRPAYQNVL
jgi:hypothetical protein